MIDVRTNEKLIKHFEKLLIQKKRLEVQIVNPSPIQLYDKMMLTGEIKAIEKALEIIRMHDEQSPMQFRQFRLHKFVPDWNGKLVKSMGTVVKSIHWTTSEAPRHESMKMYASRFWKGYAIPQRDKVTKISIKIDRGIGGCYIWNVQFGF